MALLLYIAKGSHELTFSPSKVTRWPSSNHGSPLKSGSFPWPVAKEEIGDLSEPSEGPRGLLLALKMEVPHEKECSCLLTESGPC